MAYSTGSASDLADLLSKLSTFVQANGWTEDELDDGVLVAGEGRWAFSKDDIYVSGKYDATTPLHMSLHQALAYVGSTDPGEHTDDSGNGYNDASGKYTSTNLDNERCVSDIGDGPFPSYHFFEDDDGTRSYVHVVVEIETDVYRHFGFGELEKSTDWTGGEYCYGQFHTVTTGSSNNGINGSNTALLDGVFAQTATTTARRAATIHAEDLPMQGASEKWLQVAGGVTSEANEANWQDSAGEEKHIASGGFRGGPVAVWFGQSHTDATAGFLPGYALNVFAMDYTNNFAYHLGNMPDVRGMSMLAFAAGDEITIGSDTWIIFPTARRTLSDVNNRTRYQGIAYKKVTT